MLFHHMSFKQDYAPLPAMAGNKADEVYHPVKEEWDELGVHHKEPRKGYRFSYILMFFCGLSVGVIGSFGFPPLVYTIRHALHDTHTRIPCYN